MLLTGPLKAYLTGSDGYYIDQRYMDRIAAIPTLSEDHAIDTSSRGCLVIHDNAITLFELCRSRTENACVRIWTYDVQQGVLVHEYTAFSRKFAGDSVNQEQNDVFNLTEGWIGLAKDGAVVLDEFLRICLDAGSRGDPKAFEKDHSTIHYVVKRNESNNRGWFIQPRKTNEDPNGVTYQNFFREVKELGALNRS